MARPKKIDFMSFVKVNKLADETSPDAEIYLNLALVRYFRVEGDKTKVVYGQEGFYIKEAPQSVFIKAKVDEAKQ
jgi:hypothetical protein